MNRTAARRSEMEFEMPETGQADAWQENSEVLTLQNRKLEVLNYLSGDHREEMVKDIRRGMMKTQKSIPAKYFYDARGSQLFDQICIDSRILSHKDRTVDPGPVRRRDHAILLPGRRRLDRAGMRVKSKDPETSGCDASPRTRPDPVRSC